MLSAARDVDHGVSDNRSNHRADRPAGVASLVDIGIIEHRVAPAANHPARISLGFCEHVYDARTIELTGTVRQRDTDLAQRLADSSRVNGVTHDAVPDDQLA